MSGRRDRIVDRQVLAATGVGGTWRDIQARTSRVTGREFAQATQRLIASGALVRDGVGHTAMVTRDLTKWVGGPR